MINILVWYDICDLVSVMISTTSVAASCVVIRQGSSAVTTDIVLRRWALPESSKCKIGLFGANVFLVLATILVEHTMHLRVASFGYL